MEIGFTGARHGMTPEQKVTVEALLADKTIDKARHGDCIGADSDFHELAKGRGIFIVGHPPHNYTKRAFCSFDQEMRPQEYLVRDKIIVDSSELLIATPGGFEEELRSGTWATVRYAVKKGKPVVVVFPNGTIENR